MGRLDGRVAFVTGAAAGLGAGYAAALAEAGCDLLVCGRNESIGPAAEALHRRGTRVVSLVADVGAAADVRRIVVATTEAFGRSTSWSTTPASAAAPGRPTASTRPSTTTRR